MRASDYDVLFKFEEPLELALKAKIGDIGIPWFTRLDALKWDPVSETFDFQKIRPRGEIKVERFSRVEIAFEHLVLRTDDAGEVQEEKYIKAYAGSVSLRLITPFTPKSIIDGDHQNLKARLMVKLSRCERIEDETLLPFHTLDKLWFRENENQIADKANLEISIFRYDFNLSVRDDAWPNESSTN